MDFNAYVANAIKSGIEAGKDQLIKQTLKEDHDYIMFKLHKIFGGAYTHIENILNDFTLLPEKREKVLSILATMMDDTEETITREKKCDCDGTCEECKCGKETKEEKEDPDRIMLEEIPVDKQKRITISYNTLYEAGLDAEDRLFVLKSKEDDTIYIVNEFFDWDENRLDLAKIVYNNENTAVRLSIGKLLDVKYGDIVGVDVYDRQLVIYNTGSNVSDMTEEKVNEPNKTEDTNVTNDLEQLVKSSPIADLLKQIQEKIKEDKLKDQPWFIRRYRIEI